MEKLKIAIVGCGGIANQKHMPSIRANAEKRRWSLSVISYRRGHKRQQKNTGRQTQKFIRITKQCLQITKLKLMLYMFVLQMLHTVRLPWQHLKQESMSCVRNQWHTTLQMHVR